MELSIPINNINPHNIFFADKKKNIIVDGDFIKIVYSTDSFEMNGMYVLVELEPLHNNTSFPPNHSVNRSKNFVSLIGQGTYGLDYSRHDGQMDARRELTITGSGGEWTQITHKMHTLTPKRTISFNPASKENIGSIERLCQIEHEIVNRYIASFCPTKIASYVLRTQLVSGTIKYHSEDRPCLRNGSVYSAKDKCILKISGVWETATNVGITMKFILLNEYI